MLEALQIDTLKLVQRLVARGIDQQQAEVIVSEIFSTKIYNISSEKEVTNMVAEAIRAVLDESKSQFKEIESRFDQSRNESETRFEKSRAESDARFEKSKAESDARFEKSRAESDARFEKSRAESDVKFESIRKEMRADVNRATYFIIGSMITLFGALIATHFFFG